MSNSIVHLIGRVATVWSVKSQGKMKFFKVREKSVSFAFGQGNVEFCSKSGKIQGNLYNFGYSRVFLHIAVKSGKSQGIFFIPMCGNPDRAPDRVQKKVEIVCDFGGHFYGTNN